MRRILPALGCLLATTALAGEVAIVSPRTGETVHDNEGKVPVTLRTSLANGERVRLLVNGVAVQPHGDGERLVVLNVDRGEIRLEAEVVDGNGAVVANSVPVTFYVYRASALIPNANRLVPPALDPSLSLSPAETASLVGRPPALAPSGLPPAPPAGTPAQAPVSAIAPPPLAGSPAVSQPSALPPPPPAGAPARGIR